MSIRPWFRCALLLGFALAAPRPSAAITSVIEPIGFIGWRAEPSTGSIGLGAAIGVASFDVVPMAEYVFVDHSQDWALSLDGHIPLFVLPVVGFYGGAGFASYHHNPDKGDSSWDGGVDLLVGAKASIRRLKPFGEIKYTTAGSDGLVYMLGVRFR